MEILHSRYKTPEGIICTHIQNFEIRPQLCSLVLIHTHIAITSKTWVQGGLKRIPYLKKKMLFIMEESKVKWLKLYLLSKSYLVFILLVI